MIVSDLADLALAYAAEHTGDVPTVRSLLYHRIGQRQQELFALAARHNPDFYGVCAVVPLVDGAASFAFIEYTDDEPVHQVEQVARVEIADRGDNLDVFDEEEVNVVTLSDREAAFPPRVTIRDQQIRAVADDLDGVASLRVFYSRVPRGIPPSAHDRELELPEQFQTLLVHDAARDLIRRSPQPPRADVLAYLDREEERLLADFLLHVQRFVGPLQSRFATQSRMALP